MALRKYKARRETLAGGKRSSLVSDEGKKFNNNDISSPVSYQPDAPLNIYQAPQTLSVVTDSNGFLPETTFKASSGIIDRSPLNDSPTSNPVFSGSDVAFVSGDPAFKAVDDKVKFSRRIKVSAPRQSV
jgi:hypothetical protein